MARLTFVCRNRKDKGIILNDKEFLSLYFYGIDVINKQGTSINPSFLEFYIKSATNEIENFLGIKLTKHIIEERSDYYRNEFHGKGFIKVKYPVRYTVSLQGVLGDQRIVEYPKHWLVSNKVNNLPTSRQVMLVPNSNTSETTLSNAIFGTNILSTLGVINGEQVGSYWKPTYVTGYDFDDMPFELINLIGKLASYGLFNILGDIALGTAGLASYSVSIDGLSQSIATTSSATNAAYGARIITYQKEIKDTLEKIKGNYRGIIFSAV